MGSPNRQRPIEGSVVNLFAPAAAVRNATSLADLLVPLATALEQIQAALDIRRIRDVAIAKVAEELVLNPAVAPAGPGRFAVSFTAATSVTVTHNLGTLDVVVTVWDDAGDQILPETSVLTSINVVTLTFGDVVTGRAVVIG